MKKLNKKQKVRNIRRAQSAKKKKRPDRVAVPEDKLSWTDKLRKITEKL